MSILVIGGAGFIGSHLCKKILELGYNLTVIDNLSSGNRHTANLLEEKKAKFILGDVRKAPELSKAINNKIDSVIHLAAMVSVKHCSCFPKKAYDVNVYGTLNLLRACTEHHINKFVHISSAAVYGEPAQLPIKEESPTNPSSTYGATKLQAEEHVKDFRINHGLNSTILRLFNVYGPGQGNNPYANVITKFANRVQSGKPPIIYGTGSQTRDFIHIKDAVKGITLALQKDAEGTFNIGTNIATSVDGLAKMVLGIARREDLGVIYAKPRKGDIKQSYASIEKAKRLLGYSPIISLEEGLRKLFYNLT